MKSQEQQAVEFLIDFLNVWIKRIYPDNLTERVAAFIHPDFHGIGTASHEIWRGKPEVMAQIAKEIEQLPDPSDYHMHWIKGSAFGNDVVGVMGGMEASFKMGNKVVTFPFVRFASVVKKEGDRWGLIQWHISLPDSSSEEEVFPGSREPKRYEEVSVLFTDFVGFSHSVFTVPAKKLVADLDEIFGAFDEIAREFGVEKVKTIGDAYMAVSGLKPQAESHAILCVRAAQQMITYLQKRNETSALKWELRAGIHSGPVVGGIIGKEKLSFDLWGDTVNLANRMESASEGGKINISAYTYFLVKEAFDCSYRGKIETKEGGKLDMYFID